MAITAVEQRSDAVTVGCACTGGMSSLRCRWSWLQSNITRTAPHGDRARPPGPGSGGASSTARRRPANPMDVDSASAARRRRERRLRQFLRLEILSVAMALSEKKHRTSRGQRKDRAGGGFETHYTAKFRELPTHYGALHPLRGRARRRAARVGHGPCAAGGSSGTSWSTRSRRAPSGGNQLG